MFTNSILQVSSLIITTIILSIMIMAPAHGKNLESPKCTQAWQPAHSRTSCDDLFYKGLAKALRHNIQTLQKTTASPFQLCGQQVPTRSLIDSYRNLQTYISHHSPREISAYIDKNFNFCSPNHVLITGYYEPIVKASLTRTNQFPVPLYTIPPEGDPHEKFRVSRKTIETTTILKGHEIVYVSDVFTAFLIHIQGSALLIFKDSSLRQVHYQNNNGRPYTSIGRILIDQGAIKRKNMSMQAIKHYIQNNPDKTAALLQMNERFIYFTLSDPVTEPASPSGSFNIPLTPKRSIALDPKIYPQGLLLYLQGTLPVIIPSAASRKQQFHRRRFSRFMLNQDSGKAITGQQRMDLFMGKGEIAAIMASEMQEDGCLRILLPK